MAQLVAHRCRPSRCPSTTAANPATMLDADVQRGRGELAILGQPVGLEHPGREGRVGTDRRRARDHHRVAAEREPVEQAQQERAADVDRERPERQLAAEARADPAVHEEARDRSRGRRRRPRLSMPRRSQSARSYRRTSPTVQRFVRTSSTWWTRARWPVPSCFTNGLRRADHEDAGPDQRARRRARRRVATPDARGDDRRAAHGAGVLPGSLRLEPPQPDRLDPDHGARGADVPRARRGGRAPLPALAESATAPASSSRKRTSSRAGATGTGARSTAGCRAGSSRS